MERKKFKKKLVELLLINNKFQFLNVDERFIKPGKMGLSEIWSDRFYDNDSHFFKIKPKSEERSSWEKLEVFKKDIKEPMESQTIKKTKTRKFSFVDHNKKWRCARFVNGVACSSNCNYIHSYPVDDRVYCKYYYLQRSCPSFHCRYYHGKVCSLKTKNAYEDKYKEFRCSKIMKRKSCNDSSCENRHRLPKEDNVYCFDQLSLECRYESECLYKHRDDLNSNPPNNMMTYRNNSVPYDFQQEIQTECDNVITSQLADIKEENSSNTEFLSNVCDSRNASDTETIDCEPEYYFSSSENEDDSREPTLYSGIGNLLSNLKPASSKPVNYSPVAGSTNETNFHSEKKANTPSRISLETLFPYEDSETSSIDVNDSYTSPNSNNRNIYKEFNKNKSPKKSSNKTNVLKAVSKDRDLFDLDIDKYIVQDPSEISNDNLEVTTSDNEKPLHKNFVKKGNESPYPICLNIKTEIPIIELSSDDEEPPKKLQVEISNQTPNQDLSFSFKNVMKSEKDISYMNTQIKTEPNIKSETSNNENDFVVSRDLFNSSNLEGSMDPHEIIAIKCENFHSGDAGERLFKNDLINNNDIIQKCKKIKLELDNKP